MGKIKIMFGLRGGGEPEAGGRLKQRESQSRRGHGVTERGQVWPCTVPGQEGGCWRGRKKCAVCQSLLGREQPAPVQSQNRRRTNEETSFITRYPQRESRGGHRDWGRAHSWGITLGPA